MGTKIETKYKVTDRLFVISRNLIEEKCKICNGIGRVLIKHKSFSCPECNGKGKKNTEKHWEIYMSETYPEKIYIEIEEGEKPKISYVFMWSDTPDYIDEKDCFLSEKEAQAECDRRNKCL